MMAKVNLEKMKARAADIRSAVEKVQTYTDLSKLYGNFWAYIHLNERKRPCDVTGVVKDFFSPRIDTN